MTPPPPVPPPGEGPQEGSRLRRLGIGLGIAGIVVAIAIAAQSCGGDPAQTPADAPEDALPGADPPTETPPPAQAAPPAAEPAAADTTPPGRPSRSAALCPQGADRPEILVAFEPGHPMAEAQRLFAAGRREEARALAARLLAERRDLRGLCFDRFTVGGAEIVVGAPDPGSVGAWTERLSAMDGVAYAEANLVVSPY